MLNSEFSSKFGRRPEVLASLVVLGMFSLDALAELLAGAEAEPVLPLAAVSQPASRQRASAAQSSSETFLDHGGFLLLSMPGAPPGEHFGSYF